MSAALVQDPSGPTLAVDPETALSNADDLYSPNVVQPMPKPSHSRQGSAAKRKWAQSGMDITQNTLDSPQTGDLNGYDKAKRQRLDSRASSEKRTGPTKPLENTESALHQVAEEGSQFTESYGSPRQTPPNREPPIQSTDAKENVHEIRENSARSTIPHEVKPTADSSEQSQNAFPTTPNFKRVFLGNKIVEPWYFSPYPPGDIATQAWNPNLIFDPYQGQYLPGGKHAKGQLRHGKSGSMMPQTGLVNGYAINGAGPSRSNTRHDIPAHANSNTLHICERCFVYSDRFIRQLGRHNPHEFECLRELPGRLVYDDQARSAKPGMNGTGTLDVGPRDMSGALLPPLPERENRVRIYEVDPVTSLLHKTFCKNITLFGKFFIDSKSIVFDCSTFLYYIITIVERGVESIAGFFTKEKESVEEYNLACIIVFPPYQRKGLGSLLIQFSYELSKHDGRIGSPEKPLSTLGTRSYSPVWVTMVLDYLYEQIAIPYEMILDRPKGNAKRPLGTSRTLKSKQITESGSAVEVNLMFSCTLEQIAAGAYLTASDASFALAELGLQKYITGVKQGDSTGASKLAGENNADDAEADQTVPPPFDTLTDAGLLVHPPPTDASVSSSREPPVTATEPAVPILTRDFIKLLGEKSSARKKPIDKGFLLL